MKKQQLITRYIGLLFFLFVYFVSPRVVSAVACTGLPSIGDLSLSNCILTVAGTTGSDQAGNTEASTTNTADLLLSTGASVTINATGILAVGSITPQGGSIAIENGGQIKLNTPLYVPDADADGWALDFSTVSTATAPGTRRLSLMRSAATADCGDSTYATNNVCCTVATRYQDADADTYGNPSVSISACTTAGYVDNNTDCNDGSAFVFTSHAQCYTDADGDTYTTGLAANTTCLNTASCATATKASASTTGAAVTTYTAGRLRNAASGSDCNDTGTNAANVYVSATCYVDADNDDYGSATSRNCTNNATCGSATWASVGTGAAASGNFAANASDCYDGNASARPGSGTCSSGNRGDGSFDWNCDGGQSGCGTAYYNVYSVGYCYRDVSCGGNEYSPRCCAPATQTAISSQVGCGGGGYAAGVYQWLGGDGGGCGACSGYWYGMGYLAGGYGVQACQ